MSEIAIRRLSGALGARVDGVDLAIARFCGSAATDRRLRRENELER